MNILYVKWKCLADAFTIEKHCLWKRKEIISGYGVSVTDSTGLLF